MHRRLRGRRESALEAWCVKWARARGVQVAKLTELIGVPDRIFFVPGGRPLVPEFKDPGGGGAAAPAQTWHLQTLRARGYDAPLIDSREAFLAAMKRKVDERPGS